MTTAVRTMEDVKPVNPRGAPLGKKNQGRGRPPSDKPPSRQVSVRLPADMDARLSAFLEAQMVEPSDTAVLLTALDQFLTRAGFPEKKE
jgi:hypothetical protein